MDDVYAQMAARWPSSIVAKTEIRKLTGGAISPKTLANKDSKGVGTSGRFLMGQKVSNSPYAPRPVFGLSQSSGVE